MRALLLLGALAAACSSDPPPPATPVPVIRPCTQRVDRSQIFVKSRGIDAVAARAPGPHDPRSDLSLILGMNWPTCTLRIAFVDESKNPYLQKIVLKAARQWHDAVGITFQQTTDSDAEIRVSFGGTVNQAWIGSSAKSGVAAGQPTMFLGSFDVAEGETVLLGIALHELGHTLGAPHEHQTPLANIDWNKPFVTNYYRTQLHWNDQEIEDNVYKEYASAEVKQAAFDPSSNMMYPLPASWTKHGEPVVGNNTALSERDISFMRDIYSDCSQ